MKIYYKKMNIFIIFKKSIHNEILLLNKESVVGQFDKHFSMNKIDKKSDT